MKNDKWFGIGVACLIFVILCIASGGLWPLIVGICKVITAIIIMSVMIFVLFLIINGLTSS